MGAVVIQFDSTINLGSILTFLGFLISCVMLVASLRGQVRTLTDRMVGVENELKKMSDVLVELGRQDERMNAMDRRIDDLQHGRGFVLDGLPKVTRST